MQSVLTENSGAVMAMCMVTSDVLASASIDGQVQLLDIHTGVVHRVLMHSRSIKCVCMVSADVLASGSQDCTIRLWDVRLGTANMTLSGHSSYVNAMCMVSPGVLASGSCDHTIRLWDTDTGATKTILRGHFTYIWSLCLVSKDVLASGSEDGTVILWDIKTGTVIRKFDRSGEPRSICFDVMHLCMVSASVLASGHLNGDVSLLDVRTGHRRHLCKRTRESVVSLCMVSPDVLAIGTSYNVICLYDMVDGGTIATLKGPGYVRCLCTCMTSSGVLAIGIGLPGGGERGNIRLWDLNDYKTSPPCRGRKLYRISNGDCFTSSFVLQGVENRTFNQAAWAVTLAGLRRNRDRYRSHQPNGLLALPTHALRLVGEFVG